MLDKKDTKITIDAKNGKIEIHGQQAISIKNDQGDISLDAGAGNINMTREDRHHDGRDGAT